MFLSQVLLLVVNFFTKQAILQELNAEYMGLQTVCANFCDLLTVSFSAAGTVMLFRLYKPLAENDHEKLSSVFFHFRRLFRSLTAFSVLLGLILCLLTVYCVRMSITSRQVAGYFWLYLLGVLVYNRFLNNVYLLMAEQRRFISSGICCIFDILALFLEIYVLRKTGSYTLFLLLVIGKNLVEAGLIALFRKKLYGFLTAATSSALPEEERRAIRKSVLDMVLSKIGSLLLYNTDSVIISAMVSTAVSGYYSCYYFIAYGLQITMVAVFDTLAPKIGQLSVRESKTAQFRNYVQVSLFNTFCTTVCIAGFYLLCEDFLLLWVGESVLLDRRLLTLISINLYLTLSRYASTTFRQAEGLFERISWLILFRGVFNVILSVILGWKSGLLGIIAATAISDGLTVFWYEPSMMLKHYGRSYLFEIFYELLGTLSVLLTVKLLTLAVSRFTEVSWICFAEKVVIIVFGSLLCSAVLGVVLFLILGKKRIMDFFAEEKQENVVPTSPSRAPDVSLSVILPVYNGEEYIAASAASVLCCGYEKLELLIVDDGSTDNTLRLCEEIARSDHRVRLYHTENRGQGLARNLGLSHAEGEYVAFLDADDLLLWEGMETLLSLAESDAWDVICGNYYTVHDSVRAPGVRGIASGEVVHDRDENSIFYSLRTESAFGYCWNKLYRRSFLSGHDLLFADVRKYCMEDTLFNLKLFANSPRFFYADVPVYEYRIRNGSDSRKPDERMAEKYTAMLDYYVAYLKERQLFEENLDLLVPLAMRVFCWCLGRDFTQKKTEYGELIRRIRMLSESRCFRELLKNEKNIRLISLVPSALQRIAYRFCFRLLLQNRERAIALAFSLGRPFIQMYLSQIGLK